MRAAGGETFSSPCPGASYFFRTYRSFSEGSAFPTLPRLAMKTWHCWRKTQCLCGFANSARWHSSKTQVLCGFEPNSAIFLSQAAQCLGTQVALWGGGYGRACADSQRTSAPCAWALKSRSWSPVGTRTDRGGSRDRRFGAAGFSEGGWQAARAWVRGRSGRLFPLPCLRSRPYLR